MHALLIRSTYKGLAKRRSRGSFPGMKNGFNIHTSHARSSESFGSYDRRRSGLQPSDLQSVFRRPCDLSLWHLNKPSTRATVGAADLARLAWLAALTFGRGRGSVASGRPNWLGAVPSWSLCVTSCSCGGGKGWLGAGEASTAGAGAARGLVGSTLTAAPAAAAGALDGLAECLR